MKLNKYFISLAIAGALLIYPMVSPADDDSQRSGDNSVQENSGAMMSNQSPEQADAAEAFEMAAVDYCYQGSAVDPATGEIIDFFVLCAEDGAEQAMDIT